MKLRLCFLKVTQPILCVPFDYIPLSSLSLFLEMSFDYHSLSSPLADLPSPTHVLIVVAEAPPPPSKESTVTS
jgi:hypothetical protein